MVKDLPRRHRSPIPAVRLIDRPIQRVVAHVIELCAIVQTVTDGRDPTLNQLVKEPTDRVAVCRAGERRVLPRNADAGVQHDHDEEPRLALRVAEFRDGFDAVFEVHRKNSSASPPRWLPPPTRALEPL